MFIIFLDISPLLFECCPYVGNVQVIESEDCLPLIVRVGVIALICNTRGMNACCFWLLIIQSLKFKLIIIKLCCFEVAVTMIKMLLIISLHRCLNCWIKRLICCDDGSSNVLKCYVSTMNAMSFNDEFVMFRFVCVNYFITLIYLYTYRGRIGVLQNAQLIWMRNYLTPGYV